MVIKTISILFYLPQPPYEKEGGVQRVTCLLAQELKKMGYSCFCCYISGSFDDVDGTPFDSVKHINYLNPESRKMMLDFVRKNQVDIIVNQCAYTPKIIRLLGKIKRETKIKLITCMHNSPLLGLNANCRKSHFILSILYKSLFRAKAALDFRRIIRFSDRFILLSDSFICQMKTIYKPANSEKVISIPNPLTFKESINREDIQKKDKIVLIVARFNETQKRILLALQIWKYIEQFGYYDWKLVIVGFGEADAKYKQTVVTNQIKNVEFVGKKDPEPYYKAASIFMMTSAFEGWGLTLTESQQMGVVPVAFDSYSSVHDIVTHGRNGILVKDNDVISYGESLIKLMKDNHYRNELAHNALNDSGKYELESIVKQWVLLFEALR